MAGSNLQRWWKSRTPEQKRYYKLGSVFGTVFLVVLVSVIVTKGNQPQENAIARQENSKTYLHTNLKDMSGNSRRAQLARLQNEVGNLTKILAAQNNISATQMREEERHLSAKVLANLHKHPIEMIGQQGENPKTAREMDALQAELAQTQAQLQAVEQARTAAPAETPSAPQSGASGIVISDGLAPPAAPAASPMAAVQAHSGNVPPTAPRKLLQMHLSRKSLQKNVVKVSGKHSLYLPASTILTGVTINGIDARTGPGARGAPEIVDIRVKKNAILPNAYRSNIENCEILASGYGSLESRRVYLRTNELSCVARDGGVISAPIKGYIVGSDGIVGIHGTVISHKGSKLLKSLMAGLLSGLGGSGMPTQVSPLNINPTSGGYQSFQLPNPAEIGYSAMAGGISTAAGQLSSYWLQEAKALQPVIQVNPGVSVTIILQYGTRISLTGNTKRQIEKTNYAVSQENNQSAGPQDIAQGNYGGMIQGAMPPLQQENGVPQQPGYPPVAARPYPQYAAPAREGPVAYPANQ